VQQPEPTPSDVPFSNSAKHRDLAFPHRLHQKNA
jgi:hypothetical protein